MKIALEILGRTLAFLVSILGVPLVVLILLEVLRK